MLPAAQLWHLQISISGSFATGAQAAEKLLLCCGAGGRYGSKGGYYRRDRQTDTQLLRRLCSAKAGSASN